MLGMEMYPFKLEYDMKAESMIDITSDVAKEVYNSGAMEGFVVLFAKGSTAALTTIEYEGGLVKDLFDALEVVAPSNKEYYHHLRWHDGNGRSHVRASLIGSSLTVTITKGELDLGTWQQIVLLNLDIRDRRREVIGKIAFE